MSVFKAVAHRALATVRTSPVVAFHVVEAVILYRILEAVFVVYFVAVSAAETLEYGQGIVAQSTPRSCEITFGHDRV